MKEADEAADSNDPDLFVDRMFWALVQGCVAPFFIVRIIIIAHVRFLHVCRGIYSVGFISMPPLCF